MLLERTKLCSTFGKLLVNGDCTFDEDAEVTRGDETAVLAGDLEVDGAALDFTLAIEA
jgi:hypothetical protein